MDPFVTVVTGVFVYVIGQFIVRAFIDPSRELAKSIGEISHALIFYANVYTHPGIQNQKSEDVQEVFRKLASDLMARQHALPMYGLLEKVCLVPKRSDILSVYRNLILISNNMSISGNTPGEENKQARRDIERALKLALGFSM